MAAKKHHKKYILKKKNRTGLSTIIVTLIIVLLSLVAIGILWGVISKFIQQQTQFTQAQNNFFGEQENIQSVKYTEPFLNISIRRPAGEIKTSNINITTVFPTLEKDVVSVVDLSQSMLPQCSNITHNQCNNIGGSWSSSTSICSYLQKSRQNNCTSYGGIWDDKLTATQDANINLINKVFASSENKLGLVAYRDIVIDSMSTSLTNNSALLISTINSWQATSSTCICCGINKAVQQLTQQSSDENVKSIILMSDGEANVRCSQQGTGDAKQDAIKAACSAANSSLKHFGIWSIGVGNDVDETTLTNIAACGGGSYFSVKNTTELMNTYQAIAQQIDTRYQSLTTFNYLSVIFYNSTASYKENIYNLPNVLETKTYSFNLQGQISGKITKVEIYPVILSSNGKEIVGPLLDTWKASYSL